MNEKRKSIAVGGCLFLCEKSLNTSYLKKEKFNKMMKHLLQETVIFLKVTEMFLQALLSKVQVIKWAN